MRLLRRFLLLSLAGSCSVLCQPLNIPGTSAALGTMSWASIAVDPAGNAFIPLYDYNVVVRLDATTGILTLVAGNGISGFSGDNGPATGARLNRPNGTAVDSAGNLYIADGGNFRIRKVSNGVITTVAGGGFKLYDNIPATDAEVGPAAIAVDSAGNLFVASSNRILKVSNGSITTVAGNGNYGFSGDGGPATNAQLDVPLSVAVDAAGNLYIADFYNRRIRKVSNGVITTVAGNGIQGFSGDGGPAISAQLSIPSGVAVDSSGSLFIADYGNSLIRRVSNGLITTVAGTGMPGFSGDGGLATDAQLSNPSGLAVDAAGNLYIVDAGNQRIREVSNGVLTTVAGNGQTPSVSVAPYTISTFAGGGLPVNIPGTSAGLSFDAPQYLAADPRGNVFFVVHYTVLRLDATTGVLTQVAGNGTRGYNGDGGPATTAHLTNPTYLAVDAADNLYIADVSRVIRKVSNGVMTTVAGNWSGNWYTGVSGDGGPATNAVLGTNNNDPLAVAVDAAGNLYIADSGNYRVRKVSNGVITTVAGTGTPGFSGDGGPATSAQLTYPTLLAVDAAGNLYIADFNRIRKVSNGVITTVAGTGALGFSGDGGPATSAQINPGGLAVDTAGNLYIADPVSNRIRKVSNGVITTVAGNGASGFSGDGGPATSAPLSKPAGLAVDAARNLYIADFGNHRIRKVSNAVIATVAGGGAAGDNGPATSAQLTDPQGVAVDAAGNLYIADAGSDRIRKISNGVITTVAGTGVPGFSGDNGPATSAQLYHPYGVAVDPAGSLYVAESSQDPTGDGVPNSRIRKVSGGVITSVAGCQGRGFSGDNGPAVKAQLYYPTGLALDSAGNLYFADENNYRVRKISNGVISTITGNWSGDNGDGGLAIDAGLYLPSGVAVDAAGSLYILEPDVRSIRKVSNGIITTIAGGTISGFPPWTPQDVAVDPAGNVYVSDSLGQRIVVLTPPPCTYSVAPASTQAPASGASVTIGIQTTTSCSWTISGVPDWITVSGKASGTGNATITFIIAANTGVARSAVVSISGVSVLVAQEALAAVLSDSPVQVKMVSGSGQSGLPGSPLGSPLVVQVTGHSGAAIAGITVAFSVASGSATLSAASMQSAADGMVGVSVTLGASTGPVVITAAITGVSAVKFQVTAIVGPTISAVVGAGGSVPAVTRISPGGLATIYGANFAAPGTSRQVQAGDLVGGSLPTQLAGVCVTFNAGSKSVGSGGITYVSPAQVNFQVPSLPLNTDLNMAVSANCGTASVQTAVQKVTADEASPEFLYWVKNADGRNPVIAVNSVTGAYVGRAGLIAGASFTPAKAGDYLTIYGISFGPTTPAVPPGAAPSSTAATTNAPVVMLGTALLDATNVLYAGVSPGTAGLYQLNIRVPDGLTDGDYPITLRLGSFVAPPGGYLTVQNVPVNDFSFEQLMLPSDGWGLQPGTGFSPSFSFPSNYSGWSFVGSSGVTLAGTAFNPPGNIPDGLKAALFQGNWAAINQAVSGLKPSVTYTVSLFVGTRYYDGGGVDGNTSVDVKIDGTLIGTTGLLPSSSPFSRYSFTFTVSAPGSHDLSISNSGPPGDHTAFVDSVSITDAIQP